MATIATQIKQRIDADPVLAAFTAGRVYVDRLLKPTGTRSTPEAFNARGVVRESIVILQDFTVADLDHPGTATGGVFCWIHAPDTDASWETIEVDIIPALILALCAPEEPFLGINGSGVELSASDLQGLQVNPALDGSIVCYVRFTTARIWEM